MHGIGTVLWKDSLCITGMQHGGTQLMSKTLYTDHSFLLVCNMLSCKKKPGNTFIPFTCTYA